MSKEKWDRKYTERDGESPGNPSPILVEAAADLKPGSALDLAAGQGRNSFYLARQGWDITAVDFSEVAVKKGTRLSRELDLPVRWEIRDLTEYTPPQAQFDLVCMFYLHLPWSDYQKVLQHAAAAVKPGGMLLVVGHDRSNIEHGSGGPQTQEVLYTPREIVNVLEGMHQRPGFDGPDFSILKAENRKNPVDHGHSGRGGMQIECLVQAQRRS